MATPIKTYYNNTNNLKEEYYILDGKKNGLYKLYYDIDEPTIQVLCTYVNDLIQGEYTRFHDDGVIFYITNYKNGKKNGEENYFQLIDDIEPPRLELESSDNYLDDKRHGLSTVYDRFGNINLEQNYMNDILNGTCNKYYYGNLINTSYYFCGKKEGQYITYGYDDNNNQYIKQIQYYINNKLHGECKIFDTKGYIKEIIYYNDGKKKLIKS